MALTLKSLPLMVLIASTLAQYEYEGHNFEGFEGFHHKPVVHHHQQQSLEDHHGEEYELDYHAHPKYSFDYSVKDPHTGDEKEHWETRDGDKVKGTYTLLETDGTKRVVEYEADDKNGFNAVVHKIGTPKHEEYKPKHEEYKQSHEEYKQSHEEYKPSHEEYHAKPVHEPFHYQHEYTHFDEGFVPVAGYDH